MRLAIFFVSNCSHKALGLTLGFGKEYLCFEYVNKLTKKYNQNGLTLGVY